MRMTAYWSKSPFTIPAVYRWMRTVSSSTTRPHALSLRLRVSLSTILCFTRLAATFAFTLNFWNLYLPTSSPPVWCTQEPSKITIAK